MSTTKKHKHSKKTKTKKAHGPQKPKYFADLNAMGRVLGKVQNLNASEVASVTKPAHLAFKALCSGTAELHDYYELADAFALTLILSKKTATECVAATSAAQEGLARCLARRRSTGKWGFDGPAMLDIDIALDLHDQFLALSTAHQLYVAMTQVVRSPTIVLEN
jgi:hypothetical protein